MATKEIETLIRLRKFEVDERQRAMAVLLGREENILNGLEALKLEKQAEAEFMREAGIWEGSTYTAYLEHWKIRHQRFMAALTQVRTLILKASEELSDAYRRLKTFEITKEKRDEEEEQEENRLQQIELDERGLDLHRRKQTVRVL